MENIIKEIDKLEAECKSQWKNKSSIDGIVDFARVLKGRIKNYSIPPVIKCDCVVYTRAIETANGIICYDCEKPK